jgi:ABC-type branched-subunit amino acid transport system ATPase component/ABC-type branched-subunit amino acid transport system permease subunit
VILWGFLGPNYLVYTATSAVPIAIVALGLLVLVGWARDISLATAGLYGSAIYLFGYVTRHPGAGPTGPEGWGMPWVFAGIVIVLGLAATMAVVGMISAPLPGVYLIVITLALQEIIERTIFTYDMAGGLSGGDRRGNDLLNPQPAFFGLDVSGDTGFYFFCLGWLAVVLVVMVRLRRSPMGLAFHLVGNDRQAAAAVGVNPLRFRIYAFAISGALAGLGGMIAAWFYREPPIFFNFQAPVSLVLLAIPVLAGLDSIGFVAVIAAVFQIVPVALEGLRISPYILAAVGLLGGLALGTRGLGGLAGDGWRHLRHGPRRHRTARNQVSAASLRACDGLTGVGESLGAVAEVDRAGALRVLEAWLPARPDVEFAARAEKVVVSFGAVRALDGASIEVPNQAMVGLLGPNGAGKSTLFDVIAGVRRPDEGTVSLFGTDAGRLPAWDRARLGVARTFQTTRVMKDLTVRDNLLAGAYQRIAANPLRFLLGDPRAWAQLRAAEAAAWAAARLLDIDRYWNERAGALEFSARRRAEIGRCLLAGPRLLLLDEPAAGLDPASSVALFSLLKRLHVDLGLTVLLVEHYVPAVLDTCDLVYVLAEGKILAVGTATEIAADPDVRSRYLGTRMRLQSLPAVTDPAPQSVSASGDA